jgi:hypothetical protein
MAGMAGLSNVRWMVSTPISYAFSACATPANQIRPPDE